MKYVYPAIFEPAEEGGYLVNFPDMSDCFTDGDDMADALIMAKDVLEMTLAWYEDDKKPIPTPTDIKQIETPYAVSYVLADTDAWRKELKEMQENERAEREAS